MIIHICFLISYSHFYRIHSTKNPILISSATSKNNLFKNLENNYNNYVLFLQHEQFKCITADMT